MVPGACIPVVAMVRCPSRWPCALCLQACPAGCIPAGPSSPPPSCALLLLPRALLCVRIRSLHLLKLCDCIPRVKSPAIKVQFILLKYEHCCYLFIYLFIGGFDEVPQSVGRVRTVPIKNGVRGPGTVTIFFLMATSAPSVDHELNAICNCISTSYQCLCWPF